MAVGQKTKRRNSEKRKEHSRDAARSRRSRETEVFLHLSQGIPISYDLVKVLDKTSIIRLTITYLKLRKLFPGAAYENDPHSKSSIGHLERKLDQLCQRALDGFLMVVASDGDILYVTDNIANVLGLTQVDVMGQSLFDLSHPCDHNELREMIGTRSHQPSDDSHRTVFVRMKSTITSKCRNIHIKSASYKVIGCSGHLKRIDRSVTEEGDAPFVVIIGQTVTHPSNVEVTLDSRTFVSRHSLDMKFTECDECIHDLIGFTVGDVIGKSMHSFHHALDSETLERAFKTLFSKGQANTGLYRFLARPGGYVWLETHATVINNTITDKPEHIVCIHYVVSGIEGKDTVFDVVQLSSEMSSSVESGAVVEDKDDLAFAICADPCLDDENDQSCIQFATEEILAQVVRGERDSDLLSHDLSLYSISKSMVDKTHVDRSCDEVGEEEDDDDDPGMTKNFSNFSLTSFLDKMDDGLEMRAPYIPMDDLVFSSSDTPLSQTHSNLSSIMISDPLLSSADHESLLMTEPPPPLFTIDLSDTEMTLTPRKSLGVKRSYADTDMSSLPCKAPRLEFVPPPYIDARSYSSSASETSNFDCPVSTVTSPAAHIPTVTAGLVNLPKSVTAVIRPGEKKQVKFHQSLESNENVCRRGQDSDEMPFRTVYLVLNNQQRAADHVVIPADLAGGDAVQGGHQRNEGVTVYRSALNPGLFQERATRQFATVSDGGDEGSGRFFFGAAGRDIRVLKMPSNKYPPESPCLISVNASTSAVAAKHTGSVTPVGLTAVDPGRKSVAPIRLYGSRGGNQATVDSVIGQPKPYADESRAFDLNSIGSNAVRLNSPSARKTAYVIPTQKISTVVRQPLLQGGSVVQNLPSNVCFVGSATGSGETRPLHLRVQNVMPSAIGKVTLTRPLTGTGFLKTVLSGSVAKCAQAGDDLAPKEAVILKAVPSGNETQPLYLVRKSATQALFRPEAAMPVPAGMKDVLLSSGLLTVKPRTVVTVGNALQFNDLKMTASKPSGLQQEVGPNRDDLVPNGIPPLTTSCSDTSGSSVLKNLLMKGVDVNYGYRLENSSSFSK